MTIKQRILVISDTHREFLYLEMLHDTIGKIDSIIHLGDVAKDEDYIRSLFGCPIDMVSGNNDYFANLPGELTVPIGKHVAFLTHGHGYYVYGGTDRLIQKAKAVGADIAMFGHTHSPLIDTREGIMLINPGSISKPRQPGGQPTYVLLEVNEAGELRANVGTVTWGAQRK